MKLSLEHYVSVTAWNYEHTHNKACLQVTGLNFASTLNMTAAEMEALSDELQAAARECRKREDDRLNAEIAALDAKTSAAA